MSDIQSPDDPNAAVSLLPAHQFPFGEDCALTRRFQSVLYHYDIRQDEVDILEQENIFSLKQVRYANPDGNKDQRDLFEDAVVKRVPSALRRLMMKDAFRRMLREDPLMAVGPPKPSSSRDTVVPPGASASASSSVVGGDGAASSSNKSSSSSSASKGKSQASKEKRKLRDLSSDSDSADEDPSDVDKDKEKSSGDDSATADEASASKKVKVGRARDLGTLFDSVDSEV